MRYRLIRDDYPLIIDQIIFNDVCNQIEKGRNWCTVHYWRHLEGSISNNNAVILFISV